jgi:hypothetical protein
METNQPAVTAVRIAEQASSSESPGLGSKPADPPVSEPSVSNTPKNTLQTISTICSCITTFLAIVGLSGLALSFQTVSEAAKREEQRKSDDLIARLYTMDIDLKKSMVSVPRVRELLFNDPNGTKFKRLKSEDESDNRLINETRLFCGAYGNYFEYFLFHEPYIQFPEKKEALRNEWRGYMKFVCDNSYAFRDHLKRTKGSWSKDIMDIVKAAEATVGKL